MSSDKGKCQSAKQIIADNTEDEFDAIKGYYELIECDCLDDDDKDKIAEIIADEKQHALALQAMARKYDGGIEASEDGRKEAINKLTGKVEQAKEEDDDEDIDLKRGKGAGVMEIIEVISK